MCGFNARGLRAWFYARRDNSNQPRGRLGECPCLMFAWAHRPGDAHQPGLKRICLHLERPRR